ncbi:MAG: rhomboid family intramembrane serine protease [Akkermansiaceae bacterium]
MTNEEISSGRPVWARPDLFPAAPPHSWGYMAGQQGAVILENASALQDVIRQDDQESVGLVWTPDHDHMEVPEAVPELRDALQQSRLRASHRQLERQKRQLRMGVLLFLGFMAYASWEIVQFRQVFAPWGLLLDLLNTSAPIGLLFLCMFWLMPWYEARKRFREVRGWTAETMKDAADLARFEVWLSWQKILATKVLMGIMALAGVIQVISGQPFAAALIRGGGERWRLFTAPLLHGNLLHFLMNAMGLMYLGRRIEALARWPQVPIVFLFSAWLGGECSMMMGQGGSLGASGGLMGMLGFLLVFETRHARLVPRTARRRLIAALLGTALIGVIGVRYIDNAAHIGGLVAGMVYAFIVFPRSSSVFRPQASTVDRAVALMSFGTLLLGAWWAMRAMMRW